MSNRTSCAECGIVKKEKIGGTYRDESGEVLMSWIVSSSEMSRCWSCGVVGVPGNCMAFIISLVVDEDRFRELSNRGLDVATGWIEALLAKVASDGVAPPPLDRSRLSLSLRMGRGLTGSAMDGTGILGEERTGLMLTGSDPLENFLTSEGLSRRLLACWPLIVLLLDSFQLRPCIEALATGVLVIIADAVPLLPAPPPFPFS